MKKLIVYFLFTSSFSFAQIYENWVVRYNGAGNVRDEATAVAVDQYQNAYVTGVSFNSSLNADCATIKYNYCNGNVLWSNMYNYGDDYGNDLGIDASGNVYVTGDASAYFLTVKYNTSGTFQWDELLYGPAPSSKNFAYKIIVDASGNSYVTGVTSQPNSGLRLFDVMTAKYNSTGILQWQKIYNGPGNDDDRPEAIYVDSQGNSYIVGSSFGSGSGRDYILLKYSSGGTWLWEVRYNGDANGTDEAYDVTVDNLGNVLVTGVSHEFENPGESVSGQNTCTTIKYNSSAQQIWVKKYFGTGNPRDATGKRIKALNSNEIYVSGYAIETGSDYDFVTIKYNSSSAQLWLSKYNGPGNDEDFATDLTLDNSGNVYITGDSRSGTQDITIDYATVKYNTNGAFQWVKRYNGPANDKDFPSSIANVGNDVVYVTGKSTGINTGIFDYATARYSNQWMICENEESLNDNLNDIYIVNKDTAFAVGNNGKLISTYNRGKHWNVLNSTVNNNLLKLKFINNNSGIIVGDSIILKTSNCGSSWNKLQIPFANLGDATVLNNRISSIPCSNGRVLKSNDLWNTFTIQNTNLNENIIKVFYSDSLNGKAVSENGKLIKTTNGGVSWNNVSNLNTKINNAFFKNTNTIFAACDSGKIMYSSNGGLNWLSRNINRNIILKSVYLDDENQLYISGKNGLILYSSNFGLKWEEQPTNISSQINDISFFDRNSGVAISDEGEILLTSLGTIETGNESVLSPDNSDFLNNNQQEIIGFNLNQNFPNPFNPKTQIKFTLPENTFVILKVYNILGKEVNTLIKQTLEKGTHSIEFDGSDLSSGLYFYKIFAGNYIEQKQMLLIK